MHACHCIHELSEVHSSGCPLLLSSKALYRAIVILHWMPERSGLGQQLLFQKAWCEGLDEMRGGIGMTSWQTVCAVSPALTITTILSVSVKGCCSWQTVCAVSPAFTITTILSVRVKGCCSWQTVCAVAPALTVTTILSVSVNCNSPSHLQTR